MRLYSEVLHNVKTFFFSQKIAYKSMLYYRLQSIFWFLSSILNVFVSVVFVLVIYGISGGFAGWSYYQMLLLIGIANCTFSLVSYFINVYSLTSSMNIGGLDILLTKPINPLIFIFSRFGSVQSISGAIGGIAIAAYAAANLNISYMGLIYAIVLLPLAIACIVFFFLSIGLGMYILGGDADFVEWFLNDIKFAASYPLGVFGTIGAVIFTIFLPFGLATYYPSELILGKIGYAQGTLILVLEIALLYIFYSFSMWIITTKYRSGGG